MNNLSAVWQSLIVCGSKDATNTNPCGFSDLIVLVKAIMTDLTIAATFLVVIGAIIAGVTLLTSQGNPGALSKVKSMAWEILKGYFFIIVAWLLVYTISSALLNSGFSLLSGIH